MKTRNIFLNAFIGKIAPVQKETGGYGLGLAIAKQIVEEHKGQISVRDLQPKGVIFQIRLPKEG